MGEKEINNKVVIPILKKMCEIAGHDYDKIVWTDRSHKKLTYTQKNQFEFLTWLADYIYNLKMNEIELLVGGMPKLYYKKKKKARNLAAEFVYRLGFSIEDKKKQSLNNKEKKK